MSIKKKKYTDINKKLIGECRKGSRKAMTEVYKLYYKAMYNTSLRMVGKKEDAEDIMQEAFLKAFRNINQFHGEVTFGAWLKKIVINRSLDHVRKNKKIPGFTYTIEEEEVIDNDIEFIREDITIDRIKDEIGKLAEGYRLVLSLYLLEGYDHDEIAEILGISPSTSRSQFTRAKKKLAENLKKK